MNKANRYLTIAKVEPGMILADDLLDKQGHMLLPAKTALNAAMITSIVHHGIHHLSIQIDALSADQMRQESEAKLSRLEQLFRLSRDNQTNAQLHHLLQAYRQEIAK